MKNYTYRSLLIAKDEFGTYRVNGRAWGDEIGENVYSFKTLGKAKDFIDRMAAEWNLPEAN